MHKSRRLSSHEGQPTALYRLNVDSLTLSEIKSPTGGVAISADGSTIFMAGADRRIYVESNGELKAIGAPCAFDIAELSTIAVLLALLCSEAPREIVDGWEDVLRESRPALFAAGCRQPRHHECALSSTRPPTCGIGGKTRLALHPIREKTRIH